MNPITRRKFIGLLGGTALGVVLLRLGSRPALAAPGGFEVTKTAAEWKQLLTPDQYRVMREQGTEPAGSSPLDHFYEKGSYHCAACDLPLFSSDTKFNSGTGWPSFFQPLPNAVVEASDHAMMMTRTEVHCRRCGGHLGHVFDDGPPPTGLRYCMNGVALKFIAA